MRAENLKLKGEVGKLNKEMLRARREEGWREGEGEGAVGGRAASRRGVRTSDLLRASMGYGSRVSYQLSIVLLFT